MHKDVIYTNMFVCVYIYIYIYIMEYHSAIKKKKIMSFVATWMDLEIFILNEVCHSDKDKYYTKNLFTR